MCEISHQTSSGCQENGGTLRDYFFAAHCGSSGGYNISYTYWNFSGLGLVKPRLLLKLSVSGRKSWYLSVHARRRIATDDRLRCGASDSRRLLPAKLALVDGAVVEALVPVVAATLLALFNIPTAML